MKNYDFIGSKSRRRTVSRHGFFFLFFSFLFLLKSFVPSVISAHEARAATRITKIVQVFWVFGLDRGKEGGAGRRGVVCFVAHFSIMLELSPLLDIFYTNDDLETLHYQSTN